ncbi:MAG: glycosyltransferase family 4 protein [Candidatus Curtissbacteria bacterium]|nr:glycosyltransferase family 4 protein [Candidatus Curtissbacteria bacterium]
MRIAQLSPLIESVPPRRYGGTERVVHLLTEELVKRGHDVTLFASGDSQTSAKLVATSPHSLRQMYTADEKPFTMLNVAKAYKNAGDFDIIHNHLDFFPLPTAYFSKTPTVTTLHGAFNTENRVIFEEYPKLPYVSISRAQRVNGPPLKWVANIYHGIDVKKFPFGPKPKDYLLFVGRMSLEKGAHIAIDIANAVGKELIMAAKLDKIDFDYFNKYVAPRLSSSNVRWLGEVEENERNKLMSEALCLLHPVTWREPFGLTLIEAMATGCPVIAYKRGSIPEIIVNKKTGFIVEKEKEMIKAIRNVKSIKRRDCRSHVEKKFSIKKMVDSYENLYTKLVEKNKKRNKTL